MPPHVDPVAALSQLAHEQATAALAEQRHVLEGLRTRASTQAASAAVANVELAIRPLSIVRCTLEVDDRVHDPVLVLRELATRLAAAYDLNERLLAHLASYVRASSILVGLAVLSWVADLATRS